MDKINKIICKATITTETNNQLKRRKSKKISGPTTASSNGWSTTADFHLKFSQKSMNLSYQKIKQILWLKWLLDVFTWQFLNFIEYNNSIVRLDWSTIPNSSEPLAFQESRLSPNNITRSICWCLANCHIHIHYHQCWTCR